MKLLSVLATLMLLVAPPMRAAETGFEGRMEIRIKDADGTRDISCAIKPDFLRLEIPTSSGDSSKLIALADFVRGEVALLTPGQPLYAAMPIRDAVAKLITARQTQNKATLLKTTEALVLLGQPCVKYLSKDQDGVTEIWMASGFSSPRAAAALQPLTHSAVERELISQGCFPMRIIGKTAIGSTSFRMDVVSMEKSPMPDSAFNPPAGYHKLNIGGLSNLLGGL
jgi:hypothetical protein